MSSDTATPEPQSNPLFAGLTDEQKNAPMVTCMVCGENHHLLHRHLRDIHGMSPADYSATFPGAPLASSLGEILMRRSRPFVLPKKIDVDSISAFGIGIGVNSDQPIKLLGYSGYENHPSGLPVPKVDPDYVFDNSMRDLMMAIAAKAPVYILGPTGCGKTSLAEQYAARTGRPFACVSFNRGMEPADLIGSWMVDGNRRMIWSHSQFAIAIQHPSVVVFDEYDSGNPGVTAIANRILEGQPLVIPQTGEHIYPHPELIFIGTGNTNGMGDETGLYASTTVQSFATMNRWAMTIKRDYMSKEIEKKVLMNHAAGMPEDTIDRLITYANKVREAFKAGSISAVLSTRQLLNIVTWLRMSRNVTRAHQLGFTNSLGDSDLAACEEIFQRILGDVMKAIQPTSTSSKAA
jgi:cobaltochelatase CobS